MSEVSVLVNTNGMVSSKLVAEKFGKKHKNVLRAIRTIQPELSKDFYRLNFEPLENTGEIMMSRDGFSILAMGFTGENAIRWKELFLQAFNAMEETIKSEIPTLKATIARMKKEKLALPPPKKPHGNKGLVWVPVTVETLFDGPRLEYRKAPKQDQRYSDTSRMEGELNRLTRMAEGMNRKIRELGDQLALTRRR